MSLRERLVMPNKRKQRMLGCKAEKAKGVTIMGGKGTLRRFQPDW